MKHLTLIFISTAFLISCSKEEPVQGPIYTSDAPQDYGTNFSVTYDQNTNTSSVKAYFNWYKDGIARTLLLPTGSYIKYNGDLIAEEHVREFSFTGKEDAEFEYLAHDQNLYINEILAPDTAYFANLTDTVDSNQDLHINFGGPALTNEEGWTIIMTTISDYGEFYATTSDSSVIIPKTDLYGNNHQTITLTREKRLSNPSLPIGGGAIVYRYRLSKEIFCQ